MIQMLAINEIQDFPVCPGQIPIGNFEMRQDKVGLKFLRQDFSLNFLGNNDFEKLDPVPDTLRQGNNIRKVKNACSILLPIK